MVAEQFLQLRAEVESALAALLKLATELRRSSGTLDTIHGLIRDVREPLLFVAVGEVKSGKSSLLNALFGREIARVDVLPATDKVCIYRYAAADKVVDLSAHMVERYLPIDFLKSFNIVDTPGTNTILAEHQEITENFVPRADLILFVFSVTNPWSNSAWEFLNFINKKWLKNIVFVLQQADLRERSEIDIIRRHLEDTARQKLGRVPPVLAVSAKQALLTRDNDPGRAEAWRQSGLADLEEQINLIVRESETRITKLRSARQSAAVLLEEMISEIRASFEVISRDEKRIERLTQFMAARKEQTKAQATGLVRGVEAACRACTAQGERLVRDEFTFWRTVAMIWRRQHSSRDLQMQLEMKLRQTIEPEVEQAVQTLEADLRGLWPQLHDMLETRLGQELRGRVPATTPDFARQRRELLQSVKLALAEHVGSGSIDRNLAELASQTSTRLRLPAGIAAAGGLVALVTALSSAAVADVTGIVAAAAAGTGAFVAVRQRQKILQTYTEAMTAKCAELMTAVQQQLERAVDAFYREIESAVQPLAAFCTAQRRIHQPLLERGDELRERLTALARELGGGTPP